ncbi:17020_t:CDS:1, partial [Cetraspora pellucida]
THNYNGHIIGLDLHFKHNSIRILQIYLSTSEKKQLHAKIQEQIILLCNNSNYQLIILSDFNSVPNPHQDRNPSKNTSIPESQILKCLISHQFKDIYRFFFPTTLNFTFSCSTYNSRIDQI